MARSSDNHSPRIANLPGNAISKAVAGKLPNNSDRKEAKSAANAGRSSGGATVVWPVGNQHGWRIGRVADPFGHHWEISKPQS
jgi:uncharacterized glyoxalase superfamily protein PhnB